MRNYSSTSAAMSLVSGVTDVATSLTVSTTSGLPVSTPFTVVIDPGLASEEIVTVTGVAGSALTVTRGEDGTAAVAHSTGAAVRHMLTARDVREPQDHMAATTGVHGLAAGVAVVGATTTQTLTGKTMSGASNTFSNIPQASITDLTTDLAALAPKASPTFTGTVSGVTKAMVGLGNVDNTADVNKPISTAVGYALANKADLTMATVAEPGLVVLAGNTETVVGTNTTKSVTPAGVKATREADLGSNEVWLSWAPTYTGLVIGNGSVVAHHRHIPALRTVHFTATFTLGSTSSVSDDITISLPRNADGTGLADRPIGTYMNSHLTQFNGGIVTLVDATAMRMRGTSGTIVGPGTPWAWNTGDVIRISGTYRAVA